MCVYIYIYIIYIYIYMHVFVLAEQETFGNYPEIFCTSEVIKHTICKYSLSNLRRTSK